MMMALSLNGRCYDGWHQPYHCVEEYLEHIEVGNINQYLEHNVGDLVATQTNEFDDKQDLHIQHI